MKPKYSLDGRFKMPTIIQVCTLAGKIIEKARWEVEFPSGIQEGHTVAVNIPFNDSALNGYLARSKSPNCLVDKGPSGYSVGLTFQVKHISHMIDTSVKEEVEATSMATVQPVNRLVENVILYLLDATKCDQKFVQGIRGEIRISSE
jgi:hypothetical protein